MAKSKAKANTKAKAKSKAKGVALPDGFRHIGRAPNWDMDKHPVIQGVRGEEKEVEFNANGGGAKKKGVKGKGKGETRTVRTFVVSDETLGAVNVGSRAGCETCSTKQRMAIRSVSNSLVSELPRRGRIPRVSLTAPFLMTK